MPESVACNLCGSRDARLLYRQKDYRLAVDDEQWNLVVCRRCGLGYLDPRPTADEIGRYYPARYFGHRRQAKSRYERQAAYVAGPSGRLLDIGTAAGDFLAVMARRGWEAVGIEPSPMTETVSGVEVLHERFPEQCSLPDDAFDVITAWAVFEHLHDPRAAFQVCARLLRPGGRLILQVPNLHSIQSRLSRQEDIPRHLHFFTEDTLRRFGEAADIRLERVVQTTDLFGGSGRGVLRLWFVRALGGTADDYFEMYRTPRRQRFRRWPVLAPAATAVGLLERLLISDRLVRAMRISGQIVAYFRKPTSIVPFQAEGV
jgi:2-polyprenyl-3-methyl-5-hydroxy-6-metoxy-1,4-benzoquinol methylase